MSDILRDRPDFEIGDEVVWDKEMGPQDIPDSLLEGNIEQYGEGPFTVTDIEEVEGLCNHMNDDGYEPGLCEISACSHEKEPHSVIQVAGIDQPFGFQWFTKA